MLKRSAGVKLSTLTSVPFACCHLWKECKYGTRGCSHVDFDPDYASLCACFNRNRGIRQENQWLAEPTTVQKELKQEEVINQTFDFDDKGQFTFF